MSMQSQDMLKRSAANILTLLLKARDHGDFISPYSSRFG
jgi:hypothetical protein